MDTLNWSLGPNHRFSTSFPLFWIDQHVMPHATSLRVVHKTDINAHLWRRQLGLGIDARSVVAHWAEQGAKLVWFEVRLGHGFALGAETWIAEKSGPLIWRLESCIESVAKIGSSINKQNPVQMVKSNLHGGCSCALVTLYNILQIFQINFGFVTSLALNFDIIQKNFYII